MIKDKEIYNYFASGGIRKMQGGLCLITANNSSNIKQRQLLEEVEKLTEEDIIRALKYLKEIKSSETAVIAVRSFETVKG